MTPSFLGNGPPVNSTFSCSNPWRSRYFAAPIRMTARSGRAKTGIRSRISAAGLLVLVRTIAMFELTFLTAVPDSQALVVALYYAVFAAGDRAAVGRCDGDGVHGRHADLAADRAAVRDSDATGQPLERSAAKRLTGRRADWHRHGDARRLQRGCGFPAGIPKRHKRLPCSLLEADESRPP